MKLLWLTNIVLPEIAKETGKSASPYGGWMTGLYDFIKNQQGVSIASCYMGSAWREGETAMGRYYEFPSSKFHGKRYVRMLTLCFQAILRQEGPDVIHIFGTEFSHTYAMVRAAALEGLSSRVVLNIQGLCGIYAAHFCDLLPFRAIYSCLPYDLLHASCIAVQRWRFKSKGRYETLALQEAAHVIGRTDWDRACATQANPAIRYHFANEILRGGFYEEDARWDAARCERHTLLMGQGSYPIKGTHAALEALAIIVRRYPDVLLRICGQPLRPISAFGDHFRRSAYERYIHRLIKRYGLGKNVQFVGAIGAREMEQLFLRSHVLINPSFVENESNTISEAKWIGTPIVASFVGGVTNRVTHGIDGYCYPANASYMLAHYVMELFAEDARAMAFSEKGRLVARDLLNPQTNGQAIIRIYRELLQDQAPNQEDGQ